MELITILNRCHRFRGFVYQQTIAKDVMDILHYGEESVSVAMEEVNSQDWKEKVYKPDIQKNWDKLYKQPGYDVNDL